MYSWLPCELFVKVREYLLDLDKETLRYVCKEWHQWSGASLYKRRLDLYVHKCVIARYKQLLSYFVPNIQDYVVVIWDYGNIEMRIWMIESVLYNVRLKDSRRVLDNLIFHGLTKPDISLLNTLLKDDKLFCRELIQEKYYVNNSRIKNVVDDWFADNKFNIYNRYRTM